MRHDLHNPLSRPRAGTVPWIAVGGWGAAVFAAAAGLTLLARRFSGAILASADPAVVVPAAVVAAALVLLADAGVRAGLPAVIAILARCGGAVTAASLLLPPAATTPADWAAVVIAGGLLAAVIVREPVIPPRRHRPPPVVRTATSRGRRRPDARVPSSPGRHAEPTSAPESDPHFESPADDRAAEAGEVVRQRLIRRDTADGRESVVGELRIAVPVGARLASGHVGFCPSFRHLPTVEVATDYDGVEAVVTVGDLLPWGVRIDCRLAEPAEEPLEIPVSFVARAGSDS